MNGWLHSKVLLVVTGVGLGLALLSAETTPMVESQIQHGCKLHLKLTTDKAAYKPKERIVITVTLKHVGEDACHIPPSPSFGESNVGGDFIVMIFGPDGKEVSGLTTSSDYWPGGKKFNLEEYIEKTYDLFDTGDFLGRTKSLEQVGYVLDAPGKYRLLIRFWATHFKGFVSDEEWERVNKELTFPYWWGQIESEPVWIEICPQECTP